MQQQQPSPVELRLRGQPGRRQRRRHPQHQFHPADHRLRIHRQCRTRRRRRRGRLQLRLLAPDSQLHLRRQHRRLGRSALLPGRLLAHGVGQPLRQQHGHGRPWLRRGRLRRLPGHSPVHQDHLLRQQRPLWRRAGQLRERRNQPGVLYAGRQHRRYRRRRPAVLRLLAPGHRLDLRLPDRHRHHRPGGVSPPDHVHQPLRQHRRRLVGQHRRAGRPDGQPVGRPPVLYARFRSGIPVHPEQRVTLRCGHEPLRDPGRLAGRLLDDPRGPDPVRSGMERRRPPGCPGRPRSTARPRNSG